MSFQSGNSSNYYNYVTTPQKGHDGNIYDSQAEAVLAALFDKLKLRYLPVYATFHAPLRAVHSLRDIKDNGFKWSPDFLLCNNRPMGELLGEQRLLYVESKPMPYPDQGLLKRMASALSHTYPDDPMEDYVATVRGFQVYMGDLRESESNPGFIRLGWDCGFRSALGREVVIVLYKHVNEPNAFFGLAHADNPALNLLDGQTYTLYRGSPLVVKKLYLEAAEAGRWSPYKPKA